MEVIYIDHGYVKEDKANILVTQTMEVWDVIH